MDLVDPRRLETSDPDGPEEDRVEELAAAMRKHGWRGRPLIVDGDRILTGHHRVEAAILAGVRVPVVDWRNLPRSEMEALGAEFANDDEPWVKERAPDHGPDLDEWSEAHFSKRAVA